MLILQQLYQRLVPSHPGAENEVRDKLDFTVGALDTRTDKQSLSTRYRLTPTFYLIGDLDVDGNFRGKLRYILRLK